MTNKIEQAISSSNWHNTIVHVEGGVADASALWNAAAGGVDNDGTLEAWGGEEGISNWRVHFRLDYDIVVQSAVASWDDEGDDITRRNITRGFVAWCWESRLETLQTLQTLQELLDNASTTDQLVEDLLDNASTDQLVEDLLYNASTTTSQAPLRFDASQGRHAVIRLLEEFAAEFAAALRESLND